MEYLTKPVFVKAIQFDGQNYNEVIEVIGLNGGKAEFRYCDKGGQPVPEGTITEYKIILFVGTHPNQPPQFAFATNYILLNGPEGTMIPMPEETFLEYHTADFNSISNGQHTFAECYNRVAKWEPTFEQVLVADKFGMTDMPESVVAFIKESSTVHLDSDGKEYFVFNGNVFVDNSELV
jgi:hypothetical protein